MLYSRLQIERFSPQSLAILEIRSQRELAVFEQLYSGSVQLGGDGPDDWRIQYATEFHMTSDSKIFPRRPKWEERGYCIDMYGRWRGPDDGIRCLYVEC